MFLAPKFEQAKLIIDNDVYTIYDLELKDGNGKVLCTISETTLKPGKDTRGHKHDTQGEHYHFTSGDGWMALGGINNTYDVGPDTHIYVDKGILHRVFNRSRTIPLKFRTTYFGPSDRPRFKAVG